MQQYIQETLIRYSIERWRERDLGRRSYRAYLLLYDCYCDKMTTHDDWGLPTYISNWALLLMGQRHQLCKIGAY